jgi:hypothetical protein
MDLYRQKNINGASFLFARFRITYWICVAPSWAMHLSS